MKVFTYLVSAAFSFFSLSVFSQACPVYSVPYFENFDSSGFHPGTGFQGPGTINSCWTRTGGSAYYWRTGPANQRSAGTGPLADHTTGTGQYMFTEVAGINYYPITVQLESPYIDLDTLSAPELNFFTHLYGASIASLKVFVNNGSGWTLEHVQNGQQQTSSSDPWTLINVDLSAYAGDTIQLRFEGERVPYTTATGYQTDMSIDDIYIGGKPACFNPQFVNLDYVTDVKAGISWTGGGAANYNVSYGTAGTPAGQGSMLHPSAPQVTLNNLTPSTTYDVYVRDSCGPGEVSSWIGPFTFTTECAPLSTPYSEDFDGSNFALGNNLPMCWQKFTVGEDFTFRVQQGPTWHSSTGPSGDHTSGNGKYLYSYRSGGVGNSNFNSANFKTPLIDLSNLTNPSLGFWYHMYGSTIDSMAVFIESPSGMHKVLSLVGEQQSASTDPWKEMQLDLSAFGNDTVKVVFESYIYTVSGNRTHVSIDDISVQEAAACPQPYLPVIQNITGTSVSLSWQASGPGSWNIRYRPAGSAGAYSHTATTANPATVSGLSSRTMYEFYVRDTCAATGAGQWVGPVFATTDCRVASVPFVETFNGPEWTAGNFNNLGNQISDCWTRPDSLAPNFGSMSGPTSSSDTGPNAGVGNAGNYLYTEASVSPAADSGQITSPAIFIHPLRVNPRLKFFYHMYGQDITSLEVEVGTKAGFVNVLSIQGQQQNAASSPWKVDTVDLSSFSGDTIRVRFTGKFSNYRGDIAIDNFLVIAQPCPNTIADFSTSTHFMQASFSADSSVNADSLYWDFGDGTDTSGSNPLHTYASPGTYPVQLITFNSCGKSDTMFSTVQVCDSLSMDFTSSQNGDTLYLAADTISGATAYYWDLGDSTSLTGAVVRHTYAIAGNKNITLTVVNACGDSLSIHKIIELCQQPAAQWTSQILGTTGSGMQVQFDASASLHATTYEWDFGDGNIGTGASPMHTYSTPGLSYRVKLVVTNDCGEKDSSSYKLSEIGLAEIPAEPEILVYPVPAHEWVEIRWSREEIQVQSVSVVDITGRVVFKKQVVNQNEEQVTLDVSRLIKAFYLLRIEGENRVVDQPLIVR